MPFKSQAQRRKFAELLVQGKISPETFEEWNRETGGSKLPEHVGNRKRVARPRKTGGRRKPAAGTRKPAAGRRKLAAGRRKPAARSRKRR